MANWICWQIKAQFETLISSKALSETILKKKYEIRLILRNSLHDSHSWKGLSFVFSIKHCLELHGKPYKKKVFSKWPKNGACKYKIYLWVI